MGRSRPMFGTGGASTRAVDDLINAADKSGAGSAAPMLQGFYVGRSLTNQFSRSDTRALASSRAGQIA